MCYYRYISYISDLANWAKSIAIAAVVTAMDFVSPIENFLVVILSLAFVDTFWGLAADHGDFRKSKFIRSWVYMLVFSDNYHFVLDRRDDGYIGG